MAPVCLPEPDDEPIEGERCFTAGWGLTFWGQGAINPDLMETYADIIPSGEVKNFKNINSKYMGHFGTFWNILKIFEILYFLRFLDDIRLCLIDQFEPRTI